MKISKKKNCEKENKKKIIRKKKIKKIKKNNEYGLNFQIGTHLGA